MRASVQRTGTDGVPMLALGRAREGGAWGYWLCAPCNGATRIWDEEFVQWQWPLLHAIHERRPPGKAILDFGLTNPSPGAFARCLWAWIFAIDETLIDDQPALAAAVRDGTPVDPPEHLRLLVAITADLAIWLVGQRGVAAFDLSGGHGEWRQHPSSLWAPQPRSVELPYAVVAAPPFNVVLADTSHDHGLVHFDASGWVAEPAAQHRDVRAWFPVVQVARQQDEAGPVNYAQIMTAA